VIRAYSRLRDLGAGGIALVSSVDFFNAYCRFLAKQIDGSEILRRIAEGKGVVSFE
jgi:hypothetical protein